VARKTPRVNGSTSCVGMVLEGGERETAPDDDRMNGGQPEIGRDWVLPVNPPNHPAKRGFLLSTFNNRHRSLNSWPLNLDVFVCGWRVSAASSQPAAASPSRNTSNPNTDLGPLQPRKTTVAAAQHHPQYQ
jgi:hypothetical protein